MSNAKYKLSKDLIVAKAETWKLLLGKNRCVMVIILNTFLSYDTVSTEKGRET